MVIGAEFNLAKCDDFDGIRHHTTSYTITEKRKLFSLLSALLEQILNGSIARSELIPLPVPIPMLSAAINRQAFFFVVDISPFNSLFRFNRNPNEETFSSFQSTF